jgi:hypothetical protein
MNILIINGSPRKKGLISQMLAIMLEIARYAGFKIVKTIERGGTAKHPMLKRQTEVSKSNSAVILISNRNGNESYHIAPLARIGCRDAVQMGFRPRCRASCWMGTA